MTVGTSFASDNDSISEARLGDRILLELELILGAGGSFTTIQKTASLNKLPLKTKSYKLT